MLFVAEYELTWEALEAVIAKRLEWDEAMPDGFRFVGEYVWQDGDPPFRGVAIVEAETVEALNSFVLHYGPTLKVRVHPASDVVSAIGMVRLGGNVAQRKRRPRSKKARRQ
jgi:Domain of unknown function (DUF3303)